MKNNSFQDGKLYTPRIVKRKSPKRRESQPSAFHGSQYFLRSSRNAEEIQNINGLEPTTSDGSSGIQSNLGRYFRPQFQYLDDSSFEVLSTGMSLHGPTDTNNSNHRQAHDFNLLESNMNNHRNVSNTDTEYSSQHPTTRRLKSNSENTYQLRNENHQQNEYGNESQPSLSTSQCVACDVCKQTFKNLHGMRIHRNVHSRQANSTTANIITSRLRSKNHTSQPLTQPRPETTSKSSGLLGLETDCSRWSRIFADIENSEVINYEQFNNEVNGFLRFLFEANERLSGPVHPNVKYFRLRKRKKENTASKCSKSSNPQRTDAKARNRRREGYAYELAQYNYYNQRRKVVRDVMNDGSMRQCRIDMNTVQDHFKDLFESPNELTLDAYDQEIVKHDIIFTEDEIIHQINAISIDTSPGPDRVLSRTVKKLSVSKAITSIANVMLRSAFVPSSLAEGRMVLIDKGGEANDVGNWRPITIYSVIRRIIEKAIDVKLRDQVPINCNQRGFVSGLPGCHVNTRLVNGCLKDAKSNKKDCVVSFLDISKAFDRIGHEHIRRTLIASGVSANLCGLLMSLLSNNTVKVCVGKKESEPIKICKGVPQGGPTSPMIFNIAINYIYNEVCEMLFSNAYGYKMSTEHDALCLSGFADDQAVTANSVKSAIRVIQLTQDLFSKVGLSVNQKKSQAIQISGGILITTPLVLNDGSTILSVQPNERVRYLGCSFTSELVFDDTVITTLDSNLKKLSNSSLLKPDQKLNIINQYIFPMLTYALQSAPLNKIPGYVTDGIDVMIRRTVKDVIGLPAHTTNDMFYSPRTHRGLALICASWEVYLQHFSIASKLSRVEDELLHIAYDFTNEMIECKKALKVDGNTTKELRSCLRKRAYDKWCEKSFQGIGVKHFGTLTACNRFILNKQPLSSSEWVASIKLNTNYANLNGVPGSQNSSNLCRKCGKEKETPAHVIGSCSANNTLIMNRHHRTKHSITDLLREKHFECFEEVHAIDTDGRHRFSDIVAFDRGSKAYIIDPTIRFESNDEDQDTKVQDEKNGIYKKCIPFYNEKYSEIFGHRDWSVIGLWFGSRGTVGANTVKFFNDFKLDNSKLVDIAEHILIDSIRIINQHIYC